MVPPLNRRSIARKEIMSAFGAKEIQIVSKEGVGKDRELIRTP
jgi:hypothetical protein